MAIHNLQHLLKTRKVTATRFRCHPPVSSQEEALNSNLWLILHHLGKLVDGTIARSLDGQAAWGRSSCCPGNLPSMMDERLRNTVGINPLCSTCGNLTRAIGRPDCAGARPRTLSISAEASLRSFVRDARQRQAPHRGRIALQSSRHLVI